MSLPVGIVVLVLLVTNLVAFAAQGWDKRLARTKAKSRTPEKTLLLLGLPLGALGMLAGMRYFRHKTKKRSFQLKAAAVVFANLLMLAALGWLAMQGHVTFELTLY
ncbi:MAG: DUF1294 domain-containing protein [Planctomycetes bacterium]|nr:DUF1294 domain-containing protein [Planctomycetota bacterium]MCA8945119.1 DUF1294 domain-containing protein [Planctomycetota bacterium]